MKQDQNQEKKIVFKDFSVFPFSVTHSSPETLGYAVNTSDGAVIYMADFVIDPTMSGNYDMDLGKLAYIGKQGVLCLMCESVFSEKKGHTSPKHKLETFFKSMVEANKNRIDKKYNTKKLKTKILKEQKKHKIPNKKSP